MHQLFSKNTVYQWKKTQEVTKMSRYKVSAIKTKYAFISSTVSSLVALLSIYVAAKKKEKKIPSTVFNPVSSTAVFSQFAVTCIISGITLGYSFNAFLNIQVHLTRKKSSSKYCNDNIWSFRLTLLSKDLADAIHLE